MGIFVFNDSVVFLKLTPLKAINKILNALEGRFPIEVYPNFSTEKDFYKYTFKESISDETLKLVYEHLNKYNKNA